METLRLNQWSVTADGQKKYIFTPIDCLREMAMAIAIATHGSGVTAIEDEGAFKQSLNNSQLHIANPRICAECGEYSNTHDESCSQAGSEEQGA